MSFDCLALPSSSFTGPVALAAFAAGAMAHAAAMAVAMAHASRRPCPVVSKASLLLVDGERESTRCACVRESDRSDDAHSSVGRTLNSSDYLRVRLGTESGMELSLLLIVIG